MCITGRLFSGAQFVCNKPVTGTNDPLREISPIIYTQTQRVREEETTAEEVSEPVTLFLVSRQIARLKRLQRARKKKQVHRSTSVIFNGFYSISLCHWSCRGPSVMLIINDCSYSQDQKYVDTEGSSLTYVCLT